MNKEWLTCTEGIAREAGVLLMKGFRSPEMVISYKSRTNLVTNMDRSSEELIIKRIAESFPEHGVVAEEGGLRECHGDYIWYIDPLDGTNNYAHGIQVFCVSLGLFDVKRNQVMLGVVYDPVHDEMFSACRGGCAWLNGNPIHVSETADLGISIIATGFPYEKDDPGRNNIVQFTRVAPYVQGVRRMGSAALDLCSVACGRMDGYWEPELHPWDMAGGSLIVEEAGGRVTDYKGNHFDPRVPRILVSNGRIHEQLMERVNG